MPDHSSALEAARRESPELALADLRLPGESGLAVIWQLKELDPSTVVLVLTGYGSIATAVESITCGAASYLTTPADADQVVAAFDGIQLEDGTEVRCPLARVEWEIIHACSPTAAEMCLESLLPVSASAHAGRFLPARSTF